MVKTNRFSLENILISTAGHLVVLAVMVTSIMVIINRAQMVAPDRIDIIEIDLNEVKISADETKLENTNADMAPESTEKEPEPTPEPEPEPVEEKPEPVKEPTLVEEPKEEKIEEKPEEKPADKEKEIEPTPAPKKKRIVRVKRDVVSLDRTMTVSVVDALRVAMTRCWVIDTTRPDIADIRAVAHLTMRRNGTVHDVWFESEARAEEDPGFAYVLDTIREAINVCQPLDMLPPNQFSSWQKIQLTFYPTSGKVM